MTGYSRSWIALALRATGGRLITHESPLRAPNARVPSPDQRYIEAITAVRALETCFLLLEGAGMGVILKKP